ncbi:DNA-binding bromodomain-containing protein [Striga hermonthica]|uniref:DNA-binding bromodomain-containing protein n=1 Tax=Striga hermonthica TaxID=68872 RepID=A0A9N7RSH9_STRHE|nr:DNA-binding bromodomain-containing protein [Striga hermonthica]
MIKPDGDALAAKVDDAPTPSWGTWEELVLAFAVNRHGTASWDSIASELQKRTSEPNLSFTPNNCRSKYLDLKRRFVVAPNRDSDGLGGADESAAPLLEELRKLRVAELRREVERYDLNIESLELKVKRMEEERERSLRGKSAADPESKSEDKRKEVEPELAGGGGEGIDKDRLSVNESNSTDPAAEKSKTGEKESEPLGTGADEIRRDQEDQEPAELTPEPDRKSGRADSCNGSSNSIEKSDRRAKEEPATDSAESGGGGEAAKESSDVQSTASRSRKEEGGGDTVQRGSTGSDGREHEDHILSAQSQPLVDFLQTVLAHKLGSIFQRRLRSQETSKYQKLILQHMDLETMETKLRRGRYSGSRAEFFRDILLLVNNAIVFFPKNSLESNAALEIRALIAKEISRKTPKPESGKQISLQTLSKKVEPNDPSNSSKLQTRLPSSLKMCRQRSSVADEKDSKKVTRKWTMDNRFSSATTPANTRRNSKNNNSSDNTNQSNSNSSNAKSDSKKRGAANFLNRMNKGSNSGDLLDALKNTPLTSGEGSGKGGEKKVQVTRRSTSEERLAKEKGSPGKRNVGRPPKRAAAAAAAAGKRGREKTVNEQRKRMRKI